MIPTSVDVHASGRKHVTYARLPTFCGTAFTALTSSFPPQRTESNWKWSTLGNSRKPLSITVDLHLASSDLLDSASIENHTSSQNARTTFQGLGMYSIKHLLWCLAMKQRD